jgi:hypothetical protein
MFKMHFFPLYYIEKQKWITNKYKQILPNVYTHLQTNKNVSHSTFETRLLLPNIGSISYSVSTFTLTTR